MVTKLTDQQKLSRPHLNLQSLQIQYQDISSAALEQLCAYAPNLTYLDIPGLKQFTKQISRSEVSRCPNLKSINIALAKVRLAFFDA